MRIAGRGRINRRVTVPFTFDGRRLFGHEGDTLASALLANGVRVVGRSFKYHRPRGIFSAGSEEPNALVTIGRGGAQSPNSRATMQELFEGLEVRSQNAWPSLRFDLLSANDLFAPFLGAGFYYKSFIWPKGAWEKLYEPLIRRSAGLGALSGAPDAARCDGAYAHCDLLVIGGGPAGLMAALTAARAGADVILAEEDRAFGGRLLAEAEEVDGQPGADWAGSAAAELAGMPNVRLMLRTTVTGAYDHGTYAALERVSGHLAEPHADAPLETFWRIGIMQAGAVCAYLNRSGVAAGQAVSIFTNNDSGHRTARDLLAAGVAVAGVVDARDEVQALADYRLYTGGRVVQAAGRRGLEAVTVVHSAGQTQLTTDCLGVSGGWNPTLHLSCHLGARPVWDGALAAFLPAEGAVPGMHVAGAAAGVFSTAACLASGARAAQAALEGLGRSAPSPEIPRAEDGAYDIAPLWHVEGRGRAWLDLASDVTVKDVQQAGAENYRSVEHMKRYTTQGMAPDQGKTSNIAALAVLAEVTGRTIPETGTTTFRPPYLPVPIGAMGAGGRGKGFAPERFTTSHAASVKRGAPMVEAGLWYRPSHFPENGETDWRESCDREVRMVRGAVGVTDVSTLGKIDLQGPDAAAFLDFLYANRISTLKVGRVRYAIMLREDGHVMDDGAVARLGRHHFVITTTTAAAAQVMRHLEFAHQCLVPQMNLRIIPVTEQWAQFAVAGPRARDLLNAVLDREIGDGAFPFMACGAVSVFGVKGRLFRISFSGEHGYELAVPARYGDSLFRMLLTLAESFDGGPYGMEALNVLRIEKGFLTHAELHGRVTAFDLGLERMLSDKKEFIGKAAARRPGLSGPEREQLVGVRPVRAGGRLLGGAHLFNEAAPPTRANAQGYLTSVCHSPTLGGMIGLGFLRDGRARIGKRIRMVDHLRATEAWCEICDPAFHDPEGEKARG
jgi:glycine cleavage system aminomethyltransferase T